MNWCGETRRKNTEVTECNALGNSLERAHPRAPPWSPEQEEIGPDAGVQSPSGPCAPGAHWLCACLTRCRPPCRGGGALRISVCHGVTPRHGGVWRTAAAGVCGRRPSGRLAVCGGGGAVPPHRRRGRLLLPTGAVRTVPHNHCGSPRRRTHLGGCSWAGPAGPAAAAMRSVTRWARWRGKCGAVAGLHQEKLY